MNGLITTRLDIAAAIILITALGFLVFPGQTWLQQDTQIYVPILEHMYDPAVLANDPVATNQHLHYSIYDEIAIAVRRLLDVDFYKALTTDQIVFRAAGILGAFLVATALGLPTWLALLTACAFALGASVMGPAVLTVEYEPKPRGSAVGLLLLAAGLAGHGRLLAAGVAASVAMLYHPPTTYPFWAVTAAMAARPPAGYRRAAMLRLLLPAVAAAALLFAISRLTAGGPESEYWFARLTPELERLQRLRAPYNWISEWAGQWVWHYLLLWGVSMAALWRMRDRLPATLLPFVAGMPLIGLLSVPFSYLAYDVGKWAIMAKFQPARALLWVSAFAVILCVAACLRSASRNRKVEPLLFGVFAFMIPVQHNVWELILPDLADSVILRRCALVIFLGALAALAGWLHVHRSRFALAVCALAAVLPFVLLPTFGQVVTERDIHSPELDAVAEWARENTDRDAVFLFPDVGKGRQPGIFRVRALRAIYVDWKSGGQVNMVLGFARDWWMRYEATLLRDFSAGELPRYDDLGIDYIVVQQESRLPKFASEYENSRYVVYRVR